MKSIDLKNLTVVRRTSGDLPLLPYLKTKEMVLGKKYVLDISFVETHTSTKLYIEHKKKTGPANTLAFPYDEHAGEIIMHLQTIRLQAKEYGRTYYQHLLFLMIHSMLHLKGYEHGNAMEKEEEKYYQKLKHLV